MVRGPDHGALGMTDLSRRTNADWNIRQRSMLQLEQTVHRSIEMTKLRLPIGSPAFRNIRERGCYYVDKTPHIHRLTEGGEYYFLSRPRRFGKTLLVDTMQELFEGSEELFRGLHIHDRWDWSVRHPVVRLSFDSNYGAPGKLDHNVNVQLDELEKDVGMEPSTPTGSAPERLYQLIRGLHRISGRQVVVLVDEYDKPILDLLEWEDQAKANRDYLRGLYGIIKGCARHVRFVFVTGISMYSKVSLFSGLNNLDDISLDPEYATICGYTDADLDTVFAPELSGLKRKTIRKWYNGYSWHELGEEKVYNPFDVLLLFKKRKFKPHWYRTGTPGYLYRLMRKGEFSTQGLENLEMHEEELSTFEVEEIRLNALLFQCGYLTIRNRQTHSDGDYYLLGYPNLEVRRSLNRELLGTMEGNLAVVMGRSRSMSRLLGEKNFEGFAVAVHAFLGGVPHHWHTAGGGPRRYEAFYASLLYAGFAAGGHDVRAEESSAKGRSDLVVLLGGRVFVLECKMAGEGEEESKAVAGLAQIRRQGYADKYGNLGEAIHLLSVVFSRKERNLATVQVERMRLDERRFVED